MMIAAPPSTICPKCGTEKQRADWIWCIACAVAITPEGRRQMARERDEIAAWLEPARAVLEAMDPEDPRYAAGFAFWQKRLKLYEAYAWITPEVVA